MSIRGELLFYCVFYVLWGLCVLWAFIRLYAIISVPRPAMISSPPPQVTSLVTHNNRAPLVAMSRSPSCPAYRAPLMRNNRAPLVAMRVVVKSR